MIVSVYCNTLGLNICKNHSNKSPPVKSSSSEPGPPPSGKAKCVSDLRSVETLAVKARRSFSVVHACLGKASSKALMHWARTSLGSRDNVGTGAWKRRMRDRDRVVKKDLKLFRRYIIDIVIFLEYCGMIARPLRTDHFVLVFEPSSHDTYNDGVDCQISLYFGGRKLRNTCK